MKKLTLLLFLFTCIQITAQTSENKDKEEIISVLDLQEKAWNSYDLEGFMQGYWKSDSLQFFGTNGVTFGLNNTLERYKKAYPSKDYSGILTFKIHQISPIEKESYYVMGEYFLSRKVGDANGIFMIIFKKIDGKWKIISDTSC